jgi:hypothetical protein
LKHKNKQEPSKKLSMILINILISEGQQRSVMLPLAGFCTKQSHVGEIIIRACGMWPD